MEPNEKDKKINRTSEDSFPASDPPAWTSVTGQKGPKLPRADSNLFYYRPFLWIAGVVGVVVLLGWVIVANIDEDRRVSNTKTENALPDELDGNTQDAEEAH